jgi:hypothetical protein
MGDCGVMINGTFLSRMEVIYLMLACGQAPEFNDGAVRALPTS